MPSQQADTPFSLISTVAFSKNVRAFLPRYSELLTCLTSTFSQSSHAAYHVATQMALAHNGIIRGLNSIYLQAMYIPAQDLNTVQDFLTYCQCWSESMHHHHDAEENDFFPEIERITRVPGIMQHNIEQHRAFTPGFDVFYEHAQTCLPKDYDGQKIGRLVDAFAEPLIRHLHDEIETLRALDKHDSERVRQAYQRLEKSLMATDNVSHLLTLVTLLMVTLSIESPPSFLGPLTDVSRMAFMIFRLSHSSCHISSITYLRGDIVVCGASIHAPFGGFPESWLSRGKEKGFCWQVNSSSGALCSAQAAKQVALPNSAGV